MVTMTFYWLVVWNMFLIFHTLGMSSSQLTVGISPTRNYGSLLIFVDTNIFILSTKVPKKSSQITLLYKNLWFILAYINQSEELGFFRTGFPVR
jgi:hypothetical protein